MNENDNSDRFLQCVSESSLDNPNLSQESFIMREGTRFPVMQGPPGTGKSLAMGYATLQAAHDRLDRGETFYGNVVGPSHKAIDAILDKTAEFLSVLEEETEFDLSSLRMIRVDTRDGSVKPPDGVERFNYHTDDSLLGELKSNLDRREQGTQSGLGQFGGGVSEESFLFFSTASGSYNVVRKVFGETIRPIFNFLAVDEASMMTMPDFFLAGSSVIRNSPVLIAGDHRQLSPVQKHDWEKEDRRTIREIAPYLSVMDFFRLVSDDDEFGIDELFDETRFGSESLPIDRLEITYRCDPKVADILSAMVYEQDGIRYRSYLSELSDEKYSEVTDQLEIRSTGERGVDVILDPAAPIVVVVHEENESQQSNLMEAALVRRVAKRIISDDIGVITPHNAQKGRLINELDGVVDPSNIDTVDSFQGSEKNAIIVSGTVSDPDYVRKESQFILSSNRLNVALSRMKKKLVVVVSESLVNFIPNDPEEYTDSRLWKKLYNHVEQESDGPVWTGELSELVPRDIDNPSLDKQARIYTIKR